jgi:hypothetical protein
MTDSILRSEYLKVKTSCIVDWTGAQASDAIRELAIMSLQFLVDQCQEIDLISKVANKHYFTFQRGRTFARPANRELFVSDPTELSTLWDQWLSQEIDIAGFAKLSYTVALAPCLAMEIFDRQNKKGPATYFECYIGHMFAKWLGVRPTKRARLPVFGRGVLMTMDFLFETDNGTGRIHLSVKMSSRERVVQAWAHQRLLNAAYGENAYQGIMVLFAETKLDSRSLEVVEICVPDQWLAYQSLLARMNRIYYFDIPDRYKALTLQYPEAIVIKSFSVLLIESEREAVLRPKSAQS